MASECIVNGLSGKDIEQNQMLPTHFKHSYVVFILVAEWSYHIDWVLPVSRGNGAILRSISVKILSDNFYIKTALKLFSLTGAKLFERAPADFFIL